tara:strand:- start:3438 stop:3668 length:231 start_codon:yes stop_codon:yes gene_type:complete
VKEELDRFDEDLKSIVDVKLYKLIAYLEILRKNISSTNSQELDNYYHILGNVRYELKKLLGHHIVGDTYVVNGDEL